MLTLCAWKYRYSDDETKTQLNTNNVKEVEDPKKVLVNVSAPRPKRRRIWRRRKIGETGIDDDKAPSLS